MAALPLAIGMEASVSPAAEITYVGVDLDQTNFQTGLDYGNAGCWFPQFNASSARSKKPTDQNERNALPAWAGPMVHMLPHEVWKFPNRTFSQDGPTATKGGIAAWNEFTLPNGETGRSGIILDCFAASSTNNTVNRIVLGPATPSRFLLRIVVDNTAGEHNAINRIRARGNHDGVDINPPSFPAPGQEGFNGIADVYTFRFQGFDDGDFIKIQFNGMPGKCDDGGSGGASFAGLLFDLDE